MTEEQKKQLEQQLWNIANTLRGRMDADEFRDYILGFIFFKYLSEKLLAYANEILSEDDINYLDIPEGTEDGEEILEAVKDETVAHLGYFLRPSELFSQIAERGAAKGKEGASTFILDDLTRILSNIEKSTMGTESEDDFDKLFEDLDLTSTKLGRTEKAKNEVIVKVLTHLNEIDFELYKSDSDVLGDAYEYLIGKFAAGAGKKAGEFYTPREVSTVLARIVTSGKERLRSVYDPTCGSGSLLLRVAREAENADEVEFYGQERNRTTYNLARMNMLLHGVHYSRFNIRQEDTLEHPQHPLDMRFEAVVANPPFSANWSANVTLETDDRFSQYGRLAPASKADFAFVQHMLHYLDDNGTMAVILPHGVLFRGGAEAHIREFLIREKNWLDAVIGLPPNIFYGTSISTCVLVFKKCRVNPDEILFVDSSKYFDKLKNQNVLRKEDVDRIVKAYRDRANIKKYSRKVTMDEIVENDFNLNIPRYVDTFEDDEPVDLKVIASALLISQEHFEKADHQIEKFVKELNIPAPAGSNADLMRRYKHGVMQQLFSQTVRFQQDDGKAFPDWTSRRFAEVFDWVRTNNLSREFLTYDGGAVQNIHYGDIHTKFKANFRQSLETVPYISDTRITKLIADDEFCQIGDVVIADASEDYADIGKVIEIVEVLPQSLVAGLHTHLARPKPDTVVLGFSGYLLRSTEMRKQIMRIAQGISVLGISKANLEQLIVCLPHPAEQRKIANFLAALDVKIDVVAAPITQTKAFKQGLLQQTFA